MAIHIHAPKIICITSQKADAELPVNTKADFATIIDIIAAISGMTIARSGLNANLIRFLNLRYESVKLNSSIAIITIAYPDISNIGISTQTRKTDRNESAIFTHIE